LQEPSVYALKIFWNRLFNLHLAETDLTVPSKTLLAKR